MKINEKEKMYLLFGNVNATFKPIIKPTFATTPGQNLGLNNIFCSV